MVGARVAQPRRAVELTLAVHVFRYLLHIRVVQLLERGGLADRLSVGGADVGVWIGSREIAERVLECRGQRCDIEGRSSHRWLGKRACDLMISLVCPVCSSSDTPACSSLCSIRRCLDYNVLRA